MDAKTTFSKSPSEIKRMVDRMKAAPREALKDAAVQCKLLYDKTHETWNHKVEFGTEFKDTVKESRVTVSTQDDVYRWVNSGTKDHPIEAKRGEFLIFQKFYTPRTKPNWIGSGSSSYSGPIQKRRQVHHPGIREPRLFDVAVTEEMRKILPEWIRVELARTLSTS